MQSPHADFLVGSPVSRVRNMHSWSIVSILISLGRFCVALGFEKVVVSSVYREWQTDGKSSWMTDTQFEKKHGYSLFAYQKLDPKVAYYFNHNRGSETGIYLKYIVDHYENFPDVAIFVHAHPHEHQSKWLDMVNCIRPNESWYNIDYGEGSWITREPGNWGPLVGVAMEQCWRDVLQTTWDLNGNKTEFNRRLPPGTRIIVSTIGSNQFLLSREMVHKRPLHVWSALLNMLAIEPLCHKGEPEYDDLFEYRRNHLKTGSEDTHQTDEESRRGNLQSGAGEILSHVIFGHQPFDMAYLTQQEMCQNFIKGCPGSPCR